jgi:hypothetical protein
VRSERSNAYESTPDNDHRTKPPLLLFLGREGVGAAPFNEHAAWCGVQTAI